MANIWPECKKFGVAAEGSDSKKVRSQMAPPPGGTKVRNLGLFNDQTSWWFHAGLYNIMYVAGSKMGNS